MIDLSFLTEEEQEAIMKVLQRDAELKKAEEDRVRVLEDTVEDNNELKNKTGQWFYEAKSKRHRDKIHGADLIRASIRKKKPQTIAELSQSRTDKSKKSWVNNVNKDIFIPPELFGVMEEPEKEEEEEKTQAQFYRSVPRVDNLSLEEADTSVQKAVSSPSKQRKNPFNDAALDDDFALTSENGISENGSPHLQQIPGKDLLTPSRTRQSSKRLPKSDSNKAIQISSDAVDGSERRGEQIPKPKIRTVTYKIADLHSDSDSSATKPAKRTDSMNGTGARKGILKRSPSSSSTDSEILRISQNFDSPNKSMLPTTTIIEGDAERNYLGDIHIPDESSQNSIDRLKQVRFTSVVVQDELPQTPNSHKGKEIGEFHLLESDFGKNTMDDIDGFTYLHNDHGSSENGMPTHPETIDLEYNVAETVSEEEDGDATPSQSISSDVDLNLVADVPQLEKIPSSSTITIESHSPIYQHPQENVSPPDVTSVRTTKEISGNIKENGFPTSETFIESDTTDLSYPTVQPSKLTIDQAPIYAQIKSPRVSKLNSTDIQQGKESIDATDPSCKTENILTEIIRPNHEDARQNVNVLMHTGHLISNTNAQGREELTFGKSKTGGGKYENTAVVSIHENIETEDGTKEGKYIDQRWKKEATELTTEQSLVWKRLDSGAKKTYETTENPKVKLLETTLLIGTEDPQSSLGNRSNVDAASVDTSEKDHKPSEQDNVENTKSSEKRQGISAYNKEFKGHELNFLKEEDISQSARVTWRRPQILEQREALTSLEANELYEGKMQHKLSKEEQQNIIEGPRKDTPPKAKISESNVALDKLYSEVDHESTHANHTKSVTMSFGNAFHAEEKRPLEKWIQNSNPSNSLEDVAPFTGQVTVEKTILPKADHNMFHIVSSSSLYQTMEEKTFHQEETEVIQRTIAPPKANLEEFKSRLEKFHTEASVTQTDADIGVQEHVSTPEQQIPKKEIMEQAEKTMSPPKGKVSEFHTGLGKMQEKPPLTMHHEIQEQQSYWKSAIEKPFNQEVREVTLKTVSPPKYDLNEFNIKLEKLIVESKGPSSAVQQSVNEVVHVEKNTTIEHQIFVGSPKEGIIDKAVVSPNTELGKSNTGLEEPFKTSPAHYKTPGEKISLKHPIDEALPREVNELVVRTEAPQKMYPSQFINDLKKLSLEASTSTWPVHQEPINMGKVPVEDSTQEQQNLFQFPRKDIADPVEKPVQKEEFSKSNTQLSESTSPLYNKTPEDKMSFELPRKEVHSIEAIEVNAKHVSPSKADLNEFKIGLAKLPEETSKTSLPVLQKSTVVMEIQGQNSTREQLSLVGRPSEEVVETVENRVALLKAEINEADTELGKFSAGPSSPSRTRSPGQNPPFEHHTDEAPPQEVKETFEKTAALPKSDHNEFNKRLEKLSMEDSPSMSQVHTKTSEVVKIQGDESRQEEKNTLFVEKTVAHPKEEHNTFNTRLNELLKESTSPLHQKTQADQSSFKPPRGQVPPQESIVKSIAPTTPKLYEGFKKLHNEDPEPSLPMLQKATVVIPIQEKVSTKKQQNPVGNLGNEAVEFVGKTITPQTADPVEGHTGMEAPLQHQTLVEKSSLEHNSEEALHEVKEVVIKTVVPPKTDFREFNSSLSKLFTETSLSSSSVCPEAIGNITIQKHTTDQKQSLLELPNEATVAPPKPDVINFRAVLKKIEKGEPHVCSLPTQSEQVKLLNLNDSQHEQGKIFKKEIEYSYNDSSGCEKNVAVREKPPKNEFCELSTSLEKPFKESSSSSYQETPGQQGSPESPKEAQEVFVRTVAPSKAGLGEFNNALEKLHMEAFVSCPAGQQVCEVSKNQEDNSTQEEQTHFGCPKKVIDTTVGRTVTQPNVELSGFNASLEKRHEELSSPLHHKTPEENVSFKPISEKVLCQEASEVITKTSVPTKADLEEFKIGLQKLHKEASQSLPVHQKSTVLMNIQDTNSIQKQQSPVGHPMEEVVETSEKTVTLPKTKHDAKLETLPSLPVLQRSTVVIKVQEKDSTQKQKSIVGYPMDEAEETVGKRITLPTADLSEIDTGLEVPLLQKPQEQKGSLQHPREEALQEVKEVIVKDVVTPKANPSDYNRSLRKLFTEASQSSPVLEARVESKIKEDSTQEKQSLCQHPKEETEEGTVIPPKSDMIEFKDSLKEIQKEDPDIVLNQEVMEVTVKTAVPPNADLHEFNTGLEKLHKEASKSLPALQKDTIVDKIQENDSAQKQKSTLEHHREEALEVKEVVVKAVVPPNTDLCEFNSSLKKLFTESSLPSSSSPVHHEASGKTNSQEDSIHQKLCPLEDLREDTVERTGAPPKPDPIEYRHGLKKLQKEAQDVCSLPTPNESGKAFNKNSYVPKQGTLFKKEMKYSYNDSIGSTKTDAALQKEVRETVEKATTLRETEFRKFSAGQGKLLKESSSSSSQETIGQHGSSESPKQEEPPEEVKEVFVRTVAPSKAGLSEFNSALEKLHVESLVSSPVQQVGEVAKTHGEDCTQKEQNHFEATRKEFVAIVEKNVTLPNVVRSELNTSLNKQHVDSSSPLYLKTSENETAFKPPSEKVVPPDVSEVITKTAFPPEADRNNLKIGLQNLHKEASQSLPVRQKSTVLMTIQDNDYAQKQQSPVGHTMEAVVETSEKTVTLPKAELDITLEAPLHQKSQELKSLLEDSREDALQEVKEVIVKDVVLPKADIDEYNHSLRKLFIEASQSSPLRQEASGEAKIKEECAHQNQSRLEHPKEETVERTFAPPKSDLIEFRDGLKKLQKEAQDMCSLPTRSESAETINKNAYATEHETFLKKEMKHGFSDSSGSMKIDAVCQKEVRKTVQKVTLPKTEVCELSAGLEKPLKESSSSSSNRETLGPCVPSINPHKAAAQPQEVREVCVRTITPSKGGLSEFNNALEKLHVEAFKSSSPVYQKAGQLVKTRGEGSTNEKQNHVGCSRIETEETIEQTIAQSNIECSESSTGVNKQHEESSSPLLHNTLQEQRSFKRPREEVLPLEVKECIVNTIVSPKADHIEFQTGLQKLHKEAFESLPGVQKAAVVIKIQAKYCTQEQQRLIGDQCKDEVETPEKVVVAPTVELSEVNPDLSKYLEPVSPSRVMSPKQKPSFEHPVGGLPQHVRKVTVKTVASPKAELDTFNSGSEELLKESSVSSSPVDQQTVSMINIQEQESTQDQSLLRHTMKETVMAGGMTAAAPKLHLRETTTGFVKLTRGAVYISTLPSQFESGTGVSEDASQPGQQPIVKILNSSIDSQNFVTMDTVPLKEVMETVAKTTAPQKNVIEFNNGLDKLLIESFSPLHQETLGQPHSSEHPKVDSPSQEVKEVIVRTVTPSKAGHRECSDGLEKLAIEATVPSCPPHQKATGVFMPQETSSRQKTHYSFKKVMLHRASSFTDANRQIPKDVEPENEFNTELKKLIKDTSEASSALDNNTNHLGDVHGSTFEDSKQEVHHVMHAGQARSTLQKHAELPNREANIAGGNIQSVQKGLSVKNILLSRNADGRQRVQSLLPVLKETLHETILVPKTEISGFHIGFEKICMESSEASTKLVQPADHDDVHEHSHELSQDIFDEKTQNRSPTVDATQKMIQLHSDKSHQKEVQRRLSTKNIQLHHSIGPQKEKPLPHEVIEAIDQTVAVPTTDLHAFHIGLEKLYKEASERMPTFDETLGSEEDTHGNDSEKDQERMHQTMHNGQTSHTSEEIVQLPSKRKDPREDICQPSQKRLSTTKIQLRHSVSDVYQQEKFLPQVGELANRDVILSKTAPAASGIVFENLCAEASNVSDTFNHFTDSRDNSYGNISEPEQGKSYKIMHLGPMANSQQIIQLPGSNEDLQEQHSRALPMSLSTKKLQLYRGASDTYQLKTNVLQEVGDKVDKVVALPKTEVDTFHIGLKNIYTEPFNASTSLDKVPDDQESMYAIIPKQDQERLNRNMSQELARHPSREKDRQEENAKPVQRTVSTKKIQLNIGASDRYQQVKYLPPKNEETDKTVYVPKTEHAAFHVTLDKQHKDALTSSPALLESADNKKEHSRPLEMSLSTKKIQLCHSVSIRHQQEKVHPQEVIQPLESAVTTMEEKGICTAGLEELQQKTQCDPRTDEHHAPASQSEDKCLLNQNASSLSLNQSHLIGSIGIEMPTYDQEKSESGLIENAHLENEDTSCKPDERKCILLHNAARTNVATASKTFQTTEKHRGEITLKEDNLNVNNGKISGQNKTPDLSTPTSFMRKTPLVKDKEITKVKRSSIELRLYSPCENENLSRRLSFNRSEGNINLHEKGWRNSDREHF